MIHACRYQTVVIHKVLTTSIVYNVVVCLELRYSCLCVCHCIFLTQSFRKTFSTIRFKLFGWCFAALIPTCADKSGHEVIALPAQSPHRVPTGS